MNLRTVGTVAGITVCTVGAAYAVNVASSGTQVLKVAIFLAAAVVLTAVPVALQLKSQSAADPAVDDGPVADVIRIRTVDPRSFLRPWRWAIVLTAVQVAIAYSPPLMGWAEATSKNWLDTDLFATWLWTSALPVWTVMSYLVGFRRYWRYRKSWLELTPDGFKRSRRILVQKVTNISWSSVERIYPEESSGRLLIELRADRLAKYGFAQADAGPYVFLAGYEKSNYKALLKAMYHFPEAKRVWRPFETYWTGRTSPDGESKRASIPWIKQLVAIRPSKK